MKNKLMVLNFVFIFIIISSISIGYSAFNTDLSISGEAIVRRNAEVRITNIEYLDTESSANENYKSQYSRNYTSMSINLPNNNNRAVYQVTVTNNSAKYFTPGNIEIKSTNNNVKCEINGIVANGIYKGDKITFKIVLTTSQSNQDANIVIGYNFGLIDNKTWNFDYTNGEQVFPIPYSATYQLEVWGAQGGYANTTVYRGGYGGYSTGEASLTSGTNLYINVGGKGQSNTALGLAATGGYNGGGSSVKQDNDITAAGGGATHIATKSGVLSSLSGNLSDILIVAGGGGGGYYFPSFQGYGGEGGGESGLQGRGSGNYQDQFTGYGGSQTSGGEGRNSAGSGSFGLGGSSNNNGGAGGGGGFYGGAASYGAGAGGGSGYIGNTLLKNKRMYCYNCTESKKESSLTSPTTNTSSTATSKYAKEGNGYAKITVFPLN